MNEIHIFQCMGKIFCVEFRSVVHYIWNSMQNTIPILWKIQLKTMLLFYKLLYLRIRTYEFQNVSLYCLRFQVFRHRLCLLTKLLSQLLKKLDLSRSRPNQIAGPGPKSGPARKSESRGPENGVSRWRRPNSDIYSQNHHFGLVYDMIYKFLGMEAKNYKFGMFCQRCHPSVASGDANIRPRNASRIHTCHLFTS